MAASQPLDVLDVGLVRVETALVPLMRQAPYTLLMMRVVEIGLPLLACIFSLLGVFRYSLTEARSREIKTLLAQRHALHGTGREPVVA
jgi:Na+/melibiose symporter-like transporter